MFSELVNTESRWLVLLKRALLAVVAVHLIIGMISSYRAYFQVHSLDVHTSNVLQVGSVIQSDVVTYGRTAVDVRLELVQDEHAVTLQEQHLAGNEFGFYDPRTQSASFSVVLDPQLIERFEPRPAVVRATAVGRHQWMRLPPPVIREIVVGIRR
ncbi:MAG TPA: hypothetical protein VJS64_14160 [Pyrinomonadaceae bacterium]|nr:hypothetical protein [Pyrinomonadaceae bacterium]